MALMEQSSYSNHFAGVVRSIPQHAENRSLTAFVMTNRNTALTGPIGTCFIKPPLRGGFSPQGLKPALLKAQSHALSKKHS
jgi:hypothetical protein